MMVVDFLGEDRFCLSNIYPDFRMIETEEKKKNIEETEHYGYEE
jgi:hypothetical protein